MSWLPSTPLLCTPLVFGSWKGAALNPQSKQTQDGLQGFALLCSKSHRVQKFFIALKGSSRHYFFCCVLFCIWIQFCRLKIAWWALEKSVGFARIWTFIPQMLLLQLEWKPHVPEAISWALMFQCSNHGTKAQSEPCPGYWGPLAKRNKGCGWSGSCNTSQVSRHPESLNSTLFFERKKKKGQIFCLSSRITQ